MKNKHKTREWYDQNISVVFLREDVQPQILSLVPVHDRGDHPGTPKLAINLEEQYPLQMDRQHSMAMVGENALGLTEEALYCVQGRRNELDWAVVDPAI